ncbi:methyltransferase domain-containing protein [Bradyrhizobium sp.]|uniref:methyltransferase domain-containing protein n=1 Tax=Bradyrhizobium sp. TaxID=376 RepID=UPI003C77F5B2
MHTEGPDTPRLSGAPPDQAADTDYDLLPYLSMPVAYTQPAHLAGLAALFGIASPAADRARVLELGCASGGNLIPLAARFPEARFLGVDLSARQIADGRKRVAALGLANIELQRADLADLALPADSFDYVICHGVFSWVPPRVQDAILRIASACLVANGIAAISYNVTPGWHLRSPVRDILLHHAGSQGTPHERVARARDMLRQIETAANGRHAYGYVLRDEARRMSRMPASYILGEFLAEHNAPARFADFVGAAEGHGLRFLCEADLNADANELIMPEARRELERIGDADRYGAEQRLDFFSGRPFRRSLLVKAGAARSLGASRPERLKGLYITSRLVPDAARTKDRTIAFTDGRGRPVATRTPHIGRALTQLAEAYPTTTPVDALVGDAPNGMRVAKVLLRLLSEGRANVSTLPLAAGRATDARPRAWAFARAEAALGRPFVTGLRHVAVELPRAAAALMARLDGTHDRDALTQWMARAIAAGVVNLPDHTQRPGDEALIAVARGQVEETIQHLAMGAVLSPPSTSKGENSAI